MEYLEKILQEQEQNAQANPANANFNNNNNDSDPNYVNLGSFLKINTKYPLSLSFHPSAMNDRKETDHRYGNDDNDMGRGQRERQRAIRRMTGGRLNDTSMFVSFPKEYPRVPSFIGGGFNFESVDTPYNFDRGSLVHLDNHSKFYSMKISREYEKMEEEYKSCLAVGMAGDISQVIQEFWCRHPYLLHSTYDVFCFMRDERIVDLPTDANVQGL